MRILERRHGTLKILHIIADPENIIADSLVAPIDVLLEEIAFSDFWSLKKFYDNIASFNHLRALSVSLTADNEVKGLERIIQKVGSTIQDLTLDCTQCFAEISKSISLIHKLRSFIINYDAIHLSVMQALEKYHLKSLEILENNSHPYFESSLTLLESQAEVMRLCQRCPKIRSVSKELISVNEMKQIDDGAAGVT
ncbi:hypothetical protein BGZ46_005037 [Entomortierella lignicola]|nr:hypothetical protein BGZ46_005037 [Entomortierella lignicola]